MVDQDLGGRQQAHAMEMVNVLSQIHMFMSSMSELACAIGNTCDCWGELTTQ